MNSNKLTPNQLTRLFPNASKSLIRANTDSHDEAKKESLESMKASYPMTTSIVCTLSEDEYKLNKLEKAWLATRRLQEGVNNPFIGIQCLTFKLGSDCRFTPDFIEIIAGKLVAWETKGFFRDDAKVKLKVAARMYPWVSFRLVTRKNKEWKIEEIKP